MFYTLKMLELPGALPHRPPPRDPNGNPHFSSCDHCRDRAFQPLRGAPTWNPVVHNSPAPTSLHNWEISINMILKKTLQVYSSFRNEVRSCQPVLQCVNVSA